MSYKLQTPIFQKKNVEKCENEEWYTLKRLPYENIF